MAKKPSKPPGPIKKQPLSPLRPSSPFKPGTWTIAVTVAVLVAVGSGVLFGMLFGDGLSMIVQRLLGLFCAVAATVAFVLLSRHGDSAEDALHRVRRGQHADFGKRIRKAQAARTTVKLPVLGETSMRAIGSVAVFLVVAVWWFSPLAPVEVTERSVADMSVLLGNQIAAVVLITPDSHTVGLQPPILPTEAGELARQISDKADSYQRGRKALALGQFGAARDLLAAAKKNGDAKPDEILLARAHNEMYAGRFAEAVGLYGELVVQRPDDPMLICQEAAALMQNRQFEKAAARVTDAERTCREKLSEKDPAMAYCRHLRATMAIGQGKDYAAARLTCSDALVLFRNATKEQKIRDPFEAASLNNQAALYMLQGKYPGAQILYGQAGEIWAESLGRSHPYVAVNRCNRAMQAVLMGQFDDARKQIEVATAVGSKNLPEGHPLRDVLAGAELLCDLPRGRTPEQLADAQKRAESLLGASEKALGRDHPNVTAIRRTLAEISIRQARYVKAESFLRRVQTFTADYWGPTHPYVASVHCELAGLYVLQGRSGVPAAYDQAKTECGIVLDMLEPVFGETPHPLTVAARYYQTLVQIDSGRAWQVRSELEKVLEIRRNMLGDEKGKHPDVARTLAALASTYASPSTYAEGAKQYNDAIKMAKELLGVNYPEIGRIEHPDTARMFFDLARVYRPGGSKQRDNVRKYLLEAQTIQEKSLVAWHPDLAVTLEARAELLADDDPDEAAKLRQRARAIRDKYEEEDQ
ncbi:MAG: tetratricopeptide repeat protein [Candidatus Nealsonbacteria bacterium]|nr:tetratricopeptide repeat protein [Candidatus Nealsonbacteria bacterium]